MKAVSPLSYRAYGFFFFPEDIKFSKKGNPNLTLDSLQRSWIGRSRSVLGNKGDAFYGEQVFENVEICRLVRMGTQPTAGEIMEFRRLTGLPVLEAKRFLEQMPRNLSTRIVDAAKRGLRLPDVHALTRVEEKRLERIFNATELQLATHYLTDPIEQDPAIGLIVKRVQDEVSSTVLAEAGGERYLGSCHRIWQLTKRRLYDEYGIEWFTPAEMNPSTCFD